MAHISIPAAAGVRKAAAAHLRLLDSFFTERSVVAQGQCITVNTSIFTAVKDVHPFCARSSRIRFLRMSIFSLPAAIAYTSFFLIGLYD